MRLLGQTTSGGEIKWRGAATSSRRLLWRCGGSLWIAPGTRGRIKHGGEHRRADMDVEVLADEPPADELLALDEALVQLEKSDERKYRVVMLRYFAGLSIEDTAAALSISPATVKNDWRLRAGMAQACRCRGRGAGRHLPRRRA